MGYTYQIPDLSESFRRWLQGEQEMIKVAEQAGYTTDQAIEILKVWYLASVADNTGAIGGRY